MVSTPLVHISRSIVWAPRAAGIGAAVLIVSLQANREDYAFQGFSPAPTVSLVGACRMFRSPRICWGPKRDPVASVPTDRSSPQQGPP